MGQLAKEIVENWKNICKQHKEDKKRSRSRSPKKDAKPATPVKKQSILKDTGKLKPTV